MSHVTITDPHHFLFGHRLAVLKERSGAVPPTSLSRCPTAGRGRFGLRRRILPETISSRPNAAELQYRLVDRAIGPGWPPVRVQVIDEDLGKSGAGGVDRHGFQKLIAEIEAELHRKRCVVTLENFCAQS